MKKYLFVIVVISMFLITGCNSSKKETVYGCSDCVFAYSKEEINIGDKLTNYEKDYSSLNRNFFLGYKIDKNDKIESSYVCGKDNGKVFCIEGNIDDSKYEKNKETLSKVYDNKKCIEDILDGGKAYSCSGDISVKINDGATNYIGSSKSDQCYVKYDGSTYCY